MPDVSGPFDGSSFGQGPYFRDRGYLEPSGVYGSGAASPSVGDLGLSTAGLVSTLALGRAHVRGAAYERTGTAWTYSHPVNTNANPRIDRVVLRRDLATKTVVPAVLQGTPGVTPAVPALTEVENGVWEVGLHRVTVPGSSGTVLTVADEPSPVAELPLPAQPRNTALFRMMRAFSCAPAAMPSNVHPPST